MKTKTLVIGLLTDRIDVILCAGAQAVDGRRLLLPMEQDVGKWPRHVRDAAKAVRDAVADMDAARLQTRVFYRGPTSLAEYVSPRVKSPRDAAVAGILACADSMACPTDDAVARAVVIGCEKGDEGKSHVIVAADTDDALTAIAEMVSEAGLQFVSAAPIDAVLMASVAHQVSQAGPGPAAMLYVGEHRSFLAVAADGALVFIRPISVGLDALTHSLRLPLRLRGGQTLELSREKAREIIHDFGFPERSQVVDKQLDLTGGQIIPLLQPALQRCMVEVRQSLRFALPEKLRQSVSMKLCGPGSRTPGFTQIVSDELGLKVEADERASAYDYREPASKSSELADVLAERRLLSELELEPQVVTHQHRVKSLQRWLWAGAAAALAMIVIDAVRFSSRLDQLRQQVEALQTQHEGLMALKSTGTRLLATASAMTALENNIRRETGAQVYMGALLHELSCITPSSVRLTSIQFKPGSDGISGVIVGYAIDDPASSGSSTLTAYMKVLSRSPLLERLVLSNVQATVARDLPAQNFEISFVAVKSPTELLAGALPGAAAAPDPAAAAGAAGAGAGAAAVVGTSAGGTTP